MSEGGIPVDFFSEEFVEEMKFYEGSLDYQREVSKTFRGDKFMPYKGVKGDWNIGYGHNIPEEDLELWIEGITSEEADSLIHKDLGTAYQDVSRYHGDIENEDIREALTDVYFQHGAAVVRKQFDDFSQAINEEQYAKAAANLMYINPDVSENKRKVSEYYELYKDRADKNIDKFISVKRDTHKKSMEDNVMDIINDVDSNPLEIKTRENYIAILGRE